MADYYSSTVIQETIPRADITPLEFLVLSHVFDAEADGDGWYFCTREGPSDVIWVDRVELEVALESSTTVESLAKDYVQKRLKVISANEAEVELDLSDTSWELFFQSIVRRSATLKYLTVMTAFTCSKMRPDGFGGMVVLITPDAVLGKSTDDIVCELLDEAENGPLKAPPGFGVHALLTLDEKDVGAEIDRLNEAGDLRETVKIDDVTGADVRAACVSVAERYALSQMPHVSRILRAEAAFKAIRLAVQRRPRSA